MKFSTYVAKRLAMFIPTFLGTIALTFIFVRLLPGNPARLVLGPDATLAQVQALTRQLGLDKPIYVQLLIFFENFFHGNLGMSIVTYQPVSASVAQYFPNSLEEAIAAMLISLAIGIPLGIAAGMRQNRLADHASRVYALTGISFPNFFVAILLIVAFGMWLRILPVSGQINPFLPLPRHITGMVVIDSLLTGNWPDLYNSLKHIILPAFVLSLSPTAQTVRLLRNGIIENKNKSFISTITANGMSPSIIRNKYLFRVAFIPTLSVLGLLFASILSMAYVVEMVFSWPGLGRYVVNSVLYNDYNAIVGGTIAIILVFLVVNFCVDLLYKYFDPRIRL
ncbi:MAG: ABC transporter permease [Thermoplasmatales archaeon]|jgi:peptide/nickel transport system permease protein|nr:ABC transporter permease [Candidatus Thermoplasmatota archaeon]MDA8055375.1 ABC transporter permease [Thermoplasmatales archaeon]